ncbi:MAG: type I pantothenate kinase [Solirubrobacterales bacterium]
MNPLSDSTHLRFDRATWKTADFLRGSAAPVARPYTLPASIDGFEADEIEAIFIPLCDLIQARVSARDALAVSTFDAAGAERRQAPFVVGVTGSVAVGKSAIASLLEGLLTSAGDAAAKAISTDAFILPNAELERRGLMGRKGFPETYDTARLADFLEQVKSGVDVVEIPVYSHTLYDIVPGERQSVAIPEILIVEGVTVLQKAEHAPSISDNLDFSIYVDATIEDIKRWYLDRSELDRADQLAGVREHDAATTWEKINVPNLVQNIEPTKQRADLILSKASNHRIRELFLRVE